jgi:hypothetical protein
MAAYPVRTTEVHQLFLPKFREELQDRIAGADFVHLWNQIWRRARIPKDYGPPHGSFLDSVFRSFGIRFRPESRMSEQAVVAWFREFDLMQDARFLNRAAADQGQAGPVSPLEGLADALEAVR